MTVESTKNDHEEERNTRWLIFMAFVLIASPLYQIFDSTPAYLDLFQSGALQNLLNSNSELFDPITAIFAIGEISLNFLLFAGWILLIALFFRKDKRFPTAFSGFLVLVVIITIADAVIAKSLTGEGEIFSAEINFVLLKTFITAALTIPYMYKSNLRGIYFVKS